MSSDSEWKALSWTSGDICRSFLFYSLQEGWGAQDFYQISQMPCFQRWQIKSAIASAAAAWLIQVERPYYWTAFASYVPLISRGWTFEWVQHVISTTSYNLCQLFAATGSSLRIAPRTLTAYQGWLSPVSRGACAAFRGWCSVDLGFQLRWSSSRPFLSNFR